MRGSHWRKSQLSAGIGCLGTAARACPWTNSPCKTFNDHLLRPPASTEIRPDLTLCVHSILQGLWDTSHQSPNFRRRPREEWGGGRRSLTPRWGHRPPPLSKDMSTSVQPQLRENRGCCTWLPAGPQPWHLCPCAPTAAAFHCHFLSNFSGPGLFQKLSMCGLSCPLAAAGKLSGWTVVGVTRQ